MIIRSAIKIYKYAPGYSFDKQLGGFRRVEGIPDLAKLPERTMAKPPVLTSAEIADKLRRMKIHFGNENRKFKKRIAKFRRNK